MNPSPCDDLDGYLSGWLSEDERARFDAHLADCPECGLGLQQERIARLLTRAAWAEPAPPGLLDRIDGRIRASRQRRLRRWALALSTAAAAVLAVGLWLAVPHQSVPPHSPPIVEKPAEPEPPPPQAAPPAPLASDPEPPARVSLADASDGIVVPVSTSNPNVSMVWIYPTVRPARGASQPGDQGP